MSEPAPDDARAVRLRWIGRAVVAAIGLWFLADGLRGVWSDAQLLVAAAVLVIALAAAWLVYRSRR